MARKKAKTAEQLRAEKALSHAREMDPGSDFVHSCASFYKDKGFLTEKQITALENVEAYHGHQYRDDDPWNDDDHGHDDFDPFDP